MDIKNIIKDYKEKKANEEKKSMVFIGIFYFGKIKIKYKKKLLKYIIFFLI
jgi:hypothetical protein